MGKTLRGLVRAIILFVAMSFAIVVVTTAARIVVVTALGQNVWYIGTASAVYLARFLHGETPVGRDRVWILGDSSAKGSFDPKPLAPAENFGLYNGTPRDGYYVARNLLRRGPRPTCVILSYSFQWDDAHFERFWDEFVGNGLFSLDELSEIYEVTKAAGGESPAEVPRWFYFARAWGARAGVWDLPDINRIQHGIFHFGQWGKYIEQLDEQIALDRGAVLIAERGPFYSAPYVDHYSKPPEISPAQAEYLRRLVDLLQGQGIRAYFVMLPLPAAMAGSWADKYSKAYSDVIRGALDGRKVPILFPSATATLDFLTIAHLSRKGAGELGAELRKVLSRDCYGESP